MQAERLTYPRPLRLSGKVRFSAVFDAKVRQSRAFLTIYAKPNDRAHSRLGISISRKVGVAPKRNRIKRLLRESFRMSQHVLPARYDWVVVVRPHDTASLQEYGTLLNTLAGRLHQQWQNRMSPPAANPV